MMEKMRLKSECRVEDGDLVITVRIPGRRLQEMAQNGFLAMDRVDDPVRKIGAVLGDLVAGSAEEFAWRAMSSIFPRDPSVPCVLVEIVCPGRDRVSVDIGPWLADAPGDEIFAFSQGGWSETYGSTQGWKGFFGWSEDHPWVNPSLLELIGVKERGDTKQSFPGPPWFELMRFEKSFETALNWLAANRLGVLLASTLAGHVPERFWGRADRAVLSAVRDSFGALEVLMEHLGLDRGGCIKASLPTSCGFAHAASAARADVDLDGPEP